MTALASDVFDLFSEIYDRERREDMSLQDYLLACREDPMMYATIRAATPELAASF